jgi:cob(I)alamin adenosyltransferase
MKIYTKTGDKGTTSLIGGKRVPKNHERIQAYGTVDELIAFIGVLRDHTSNKQIKEGLIRIQDDLMVCAAILATDCDDCNAKIPKLSEQSIVWLEAEMDKMDEKLPLLESFVLPGGHPAVSFCHVARTVCRRAERVVLSLSDSVTTPGEILRYLNRLSDYFFVLSRRLTIDFQAIEIHWQPRLDK